MRGAGCLFNDSHLPVARMERSAIRGQRAKAGVVPDFASLHPGYGTSSRRRGRSAEGPPHFKHAFPSRRAMRAELLQTFPPGGRGTTLKRGRGECRVPSAPTASRAHGSGKCTRVFTASSPESPGIPARNGLRLTSCSPRRSGSFATVASRIKVLSGPVEPNEPPQDLTPASRRQDHTTSPSAESVSAEVPDAVAPKLQRRRETAPSSCVPEFAHGEQSALRPHRTPDAAASTASHPASVTIAIRPSCGTRRGGYGGDLGSRVSGIFLGKGTGQPLTH
ncbi:MAG: hypothetical protein JWP25_196 [Bradyrhizobium sp.]|jgi:hypothetical protein|nr:hypothetical protein [Bradyrhizobium sp.]